MAGEKDDQKRIIDGNLSQIREALGIFNPKHIFDELKAGQTPDKIAGININKQYLPDTIQALNTRPDEDIYPDNVLNGDHKNNILGLSQLLGPEGSEQRKQIENAQKRENPEYFTENPDNGQKKPEEDDQTSNENQQDDKEKDESKNPEEKDQNVDDLDKQDSKKIQNDQEKQEDKAVSQDDTNAQSNNEEDSEEDSKKTEDSSDKGESENNQQDVSEKSAQSKVNDAQKGNEDLTKKFIDTANKGKTGGGAMTVIITFLAESPFLIATLAIIVIILLVVSIGPLLRTGKLGNVKAETVKNSPQFNVNASSFNFESLQKALETNPDRFIKIIEKEKANESLRQTPRPEVTKLCDDIIAKTNELKKLSSAGKSGADSTKKGEKTTLNIQIMDLTKQLISKTNDVIGIALREVGVCERTKTFSEKEYRSGKAWCAKFVTWVYKQAGYDINSKNNDWVPYLYNWAQSQPKWIASDIKDGTPQPGDMVLYSWGKWYTDGDKPEDVDHIGIVLKVEGNDIYSIDGNLGDCVKINKQPILKKFGGKGARYFAGPR